MLLPGSLYVSGLESRISKAMKKLVHLDEDKAKEEMAW